MNITGQHTPAPQSEVKLRINLESVTGLVDEIQGDFRVLLSLGAKDNETVLLRFKLRTLSALQRTANIISASEAANIEEIRELFSALGTSQKARASCLPSDRSC